MFVASTSSRTTRVSALVTAVAVAVLTLAPSISVAAPIVVNETSTTWFFINEGTAGATYGFAVGPATPPLGSGSAGFGLSTTGHGVYFGSGGLYQGLKLADLTALSYDTYSSTTPQTPALQLQVDFDGTDATQSWQGRLVFEPYYEATVTPSTWQSWNTMLGSATPSATTGSWWMSGTPIVGNVAVPKVCTQANPCTWAEFTAAYPTAQIHLLVTLASVGFKSGSNWPVHSGNVDNLHIRTASIDDTYDFETTVPVELSQFEID